MRGLWEPQITVARIDSTICSQAPDKDRRRQVILCKVSRIDHSNTGGHTEPQLAVATPHCSFPGGRGSETRQLRNKVSSTIENPIPHRMGVIVKETSQFVLRN